ncbi:phage terminase large subunit [Tropicimonas sp. IMCC6043]|uniref:phage terminase large subunit n=1 Tax=Tropicimonas sp. IMCC6043 TaxID=2510645 RepID=UPI0013EB6BF1|nr:phage terminase large subunit [Tropicimonas sp. IMCC6043]
MTAPAKVTDTLRALYRLHLFCFVMRAFSELRPGVPFHYGHHIRAICHKLQQVERGEVKRLLILLPPRHLKSHCVSVAFPVWALGRDPSRRIICMSYGMDLAETFSRESRRLVQAGWTRATFPELILDPLRLAVGEWRTTLNGYRMTTSIGGPLTGKGSDLLILDDPSKAEDVSSETRRDAIWEWFTGTAMTRLDNPKSGAVIVTAQRLHEDDLPGRLIATGDWDVLELPAIETQEREVALGSNAVWTRLVGEVLLPEHMDLEALEAKRREMGMRAFEAQYQQAPTPAGGNIIRPEWFETIPPDLRRSDYEAVIQSWDPAGVPGESNDYSVCTTWGLIGNHIDLLDVHREQHLQPDLLRVAEKLRKMWNPNLLIVEAVGAGRGIYDHLRRQHRRGVRPNTPRLNKVERMSIQSPKLENRFVRLPQCASWKEGFVAECAGFPNATYDDQVDSMSQALFALDKTPGELRHCSRYKG